MTNLTVFKVVYLGAGPEHEIALVVAPSSIIARSAFTSKFRDARNIESIDTIGPVAVMAEVR